LNRKQKENLAYTLNPSVNQHLIMMLKDVGTRRHGKGGTCPLPGE